jgi:oligosaccharide repeat unit polymerase
MGWQRALHPSLVYLAIWLLTCYLISLKATTNIVEFSGEGALIIYLNMTTALLIYLFYRPLISKKKPTNLQCQIKTASEVADRLFLLWLFLFLVDAVYTGGAPLIWLITGDSKNYTEPGIPTLKGLTHTLYFFFSIIYIVSSRYHKVNNLKILLIVAYPFLMLSRDLLLVLLLQTFCTFFFYKSIKIRQIFYLLLGAIFIAIIFGVIGNIRNNNPNPFNALISPEYETIFYALPSGFTWLYIYITSGFNNILITIGTFQQSNNFSDIFYNLVPGFLKNVFFLDREQSPLITNESLNVASYYSGYVSSFGIYAAVLGGIILQMVSCYFYNLSKNMNLGYVIAYSIMFSCICISIFFDAFLTVSTFGELFLSIYLARKINKNFNNKHRSD